VKVFITDDRRLQAIQFLLKSPELIRLIESRIKQRKADIAQRKDANEKEKVSAPTEPRIVSP
jgi:hypothetical protein